MRPALSLPPSYGEVVKGRDAYMRPTQIRQLAYEHGRYWSFHEVPTTVALPQNRFAKSLGAFQDHTEEFTFRELLAEFESHNVPRPNGYADVFHEHFRSPRVPWSVNALLAPALAGGWQEALQPGTHKGTFYKYDLRSAYLWAAGLGMPDTQSYRYSKLPGRAKRDGLYRIKLIEPNPLAPFPFNQAHECIATTQEMDLYNLRVSEIVSGVTWKHTISGEEIHKAVTKVSTWKQAARMFWGRWGQMSKITCMCRGKEWQLPNVALNVPWAHMIISRVKMRMWEYSSNAVHVYVDSLITTEQLKTGDAIGDWRLEKVYDDGVFIRAPGQYGDLNSGKLERMAGVAKGSARRMSRGE